MSGASIDFKENHYQFRHPRRATNARAPRAAFDRGRLPHPLWEERTTEENGDADYIFVDYVVGADLQHQSTVRQHQKGIVHHAVEWGRWGASLYNAGKLLPELKHFFARGNVTPCARPGPTEITPSSTNNTPPSPENTTTNGYVPPQGDGDTSSTDPYVVEVWSLADHTLRSELIAARRTVVQWEQQYEEIIKHYKNIVSDQTSRFEATLLQLMMTHCP